MIHTTLKGRPERTPHNTHTTHTLTYTHDRVYIFRNMPHIYYSGNVSGKETKMRSMIKAIQDYQKKFGGDTGNGAFWATDVMQIRETAEGDTRGDRDFILISNALRAGFMVGYRKGLADAKKKKTGKA